MTELLAAEIQRQRVELSGGERSVFQRMVAIIDELPAIGKTQKNQQQNFMFRGHDDVMNALNPLLAKHGVFIVPSVLERVTGERVTSNQKTMYEVNLHVRFTFWGEGGDSFTASGWGEGTDMGDKATSKAMTMAFKYVIGQAFALATQELSYSDNDQHTAEETVRQEGPKPLQITSWKASKEAIEAYGGAIWNDWSIYADQAVERLYGKPKTQLTKEEKDELFQKTRGATLYLRERFDPSEFPPPSSDDMAEAWASVLDGEVLAGPPREEAS